MEIITITSDKKRLTLIGGPEYAEKHAGQTYEINDWDNGGWACIEGACFDPTTYTVKKQSKEHR